MNDRAIYKALRGRIDLRGYEIVRVQFFNVTAARSLTVSKKGIRFSAECIRSLNKAELVEALIHPKKKTLAVRACPPENRGAMRWAVFKNDKAYSRGISGAAFIGTLYELFGLSPEYRYRFRGRVEDTGGERLIEFSLTEPEIIIPEKILYPDEWGDNFGMDYYRHINMRICDESSDEITTQSLYNSEPDIRPTSLKILSAEISALITILRNPEVKHESESGADS